MVASFSILADMVRRRSGAAWSTVVSLVPADADPHIWQPTAADSRALTAAALLVENGLGLEGWMARLGAASGFQGIRIVASAGVTPRMMREDAVTSLDPHAWQDPRNGVIYTRNIAEGLTAADPHHAETLSRTNAATYIAEIEQTDAWITSQFAPIPPAARRIITTHDAFGYYGDRYGITFLAAEGLSTDAEPSAKGDRRSGRADQARRRPDSVFGEYDGSADYPDAGTGNRRDGVGPTVFRRAVEAGRAGARLPHDAAVQYGPVHAGDVMGTASERFAMHVAGGAVRVLPATTVAAAKIWMLDSLGVGIAGVIRRRDGRGPANRRRPDGAPGTRRRSGALDCACPRRPPRSSTGRRCLTRSSIACTKARSCTRWQRCYRRCLAVAERKGGVSGRTLIAAVVAGIDVAANLGLASTAGFRFFRPATAGGFGAVAGLSVVLGLDSARVADAFGVQYGQTSGTMQAHAEGNASLPMQVGFNAQSAVRSVDLAGAGVSGPRDVFEGQYGYFPLFEGSWDLEPIWVGVGRDWRVCEMSHKPWPAGRATHGGIEGMLTLRERHGFSADDVRAVRVIVPPLTHRLVARPDVPAPNASYARLCMAFIGAKALLHGRVDVEHCRGDALTDAGTHEMARLIVTSVDDNPDPNALAPQRVEIELRTGEKLQWACEVMLGHPARPLTRDQHVRKFNRCLEFAREPLAGTDLIELVDRLDEVADVRVLCELLAPPGR